MRIIQHKLIKDEKPISKELCVSDDNLSDATHLRYGYWNLNSQVGDILFHK